MADQLPAPCPTCPYRREKHLLGKWSEEEYINLIQQDQDPVNGAVFACHGSAKRDPGDRPFCVGWALDQRRRNLPSIQLRMAIVRDPSIGKWIWGLKEAGLSLFNSIREMYDANFPPRRRRRR